MSEKRLISPTGKRKTLGAIHPNAGISATYARMLDAAIEKMAKAVLAEIATVWRDNTPELADDEIPAIMVRRAIRRMRQRWEKHFDEMADGAGRKYAKDATDHADRALTAQLRKAGMSVKFKMTRAANDILQSSVSENVSLIKSIPSEYFTRIESIVTEGVRIGHDMSLISKGLQEQLGVTKRRAALIAVDQTRKASAAMLNARYREVGIEKAEWMHSAGGRVPRRSHVEMDGKEYDINKGMWDKDEKAFVFPGQLISCRCVSRAIIAALED